MLYVCPKRLLFRITMQIKYANQNCRYNCSIALSENIACSLCSRPIFARINFAKYTKDRPLFSAIINGWFRSWIWSCSSSSSKVDSALLYDLGKAFDVKWPRGSSQISLYLMYSGCVPIFTVSTENLQCTSRIL